MRIQNYLHKSDNVLCCQMHHPHHRHESILPISACTEMCAPPTVIEVMMDRLPFSIVRYILDFRPSMPCVNPLMRRMLQDHYHDRICGQCGEFKPAYTPDRLDTVCRCQMNQRFYLKYHTPSPTVSVCPLILCRAESPRSVRTAGILHTLSETIHKFLEDLTPDRECRHFCFVVHRQPRHIFRIGPAVRFIENARVYSPERKNLMLIHLVQLCSARNLIERVINMCAQAVSLPSVRKSIPPICTPLSGLRTSYDTFGIEGIRQGFPFVIPVSYLFPFHTKMRDLPIDYHRQVMTLYHSQNDSLTMSMPYDPLHLL